MFLVIGTIALVIGIGALIAGLRGDRRRPRTVAMLMAGMMATAFGLLMSGFAITYTSTAPRVANPGAAR